MRTIAAEDAFNRGLKTDDGKRVIPIRAQPDLTAKALDNVASEIAALREAKGGDSSIAKALNELSTQTAMIAKFLAVMEKRLSNEDRSFRPITAITIESRDYSGRASRFSIEREEDYG